MSKDILAAARWRQQAALASDAAAHIVDPDAKAALLALSSQFESLARLARERSTKSWPNDLEVDPWVREAQ